MAKIPFTLEAWLKDTSQKVVDENGRPVRIICTDADGLYPIIGLVDNKTPLPCGKDGRPPYIGGGGGSLFLVTPEEELTPFEEKMIQFSDERNSMECDNLPEDREDEILADHLHGKAAELIALAIDANAKELYKGLKQSKLDKDSIPYHLIEFMCNLYTCKNWKEIEETAEAYVTRIKAAAMKDLPRWKKAVGYCFVGQSIMYDDLGFYKSSTTKPGCRYITYESLRILPGLNE